MPVTISGSTGISGVDGSAGTPALIGSDADTGIFLAAGQVSASVNGTAGNVPLVSGTTQASTSGTSIDFTSIPSWVKRVTVMLQGVSLSGTSLFLVQLGTSGGLQTTGYVSGTGDRAGETTSTAGFVLNRTGVAANTYSATVPICLYSTNAWITSGVINRVTDGFANQFAGAVTLSGTLDRIRITTVNGTDTFDAGSINIMYE